MPTTPDPTTRFLPHAVVATLAVIVLPAVAVSFLGTLDSTLLVVSSMLLAMAISVAAASVGSAIWARRPGSRDIVFADLMLWGWLRRVRAERRLAEARGLLGSSSGGAGAAGLGRDQRCKVLQQLAAQLESKDSYTLGHSRRVTRHSERIARELGLPRDEVAKIRIAASVHDVGKVRTPRQVLTKPGPLTPEEFATVKRHVNDGADMVADLGDASITAMVRHHHERLDGSGYPDGLRGDAIPLGARIIAVADTFDAMTSNRPYQRSYKHRQALEVLSEEAESRLDPAAVAAFLRYYAGRRGVAWSAFGVAAQPRLAGWAGGALSGVGGLSSPQGLAAVFAAAFAGLGLGGQASSPTATSDRASGLVAVSADRSGAPAGARADRSSPGPGASVIGQGVRRSEQAVSRGPQGGTVERPAPAPGTGLTPIRGPSVPNPDEAPPLIRPPAVELPAVETPAVELPAVETPAVELPAVELPAVELPVVELPRRVELPDARGLLR